MLVTGKSKWKFAKRGNKIFVYLGLNPNPSFTFVKDHKSGAFKGHGLYFYSMITIKNWMDINGLKLLHKQAA